MRQPLSTLEEHLSESVDLVSETLTFVDVSLTLLTSASAAISPVLKRRIALARRMAWAESSTTSGSQLI